MLGSPPQTSDVVTTPAGLDWVKTAPVFGVLAATIFASAFLLFQVQPLIAQYILPWFGGAPAVWTTAILFFQVVLVGGYAYAHLSVRRLRPGRQAALHLALLLAALAVLPITPSPHWKPIASDAPTRRVLLLLTVHIGLPYFILASTSPLLQAWFSRLSSGASPYRLYALSNVGSLLGLISYPFLVDPAFGRSTQARLWSWGFGLFALGSAACAVRVWRHPSASEPASVAAVEPKRAGARGQRTARKERSRRRARGRARRREAESPPFALVPLLWLALPAVASTLLLAITNRLCQELTVIPLLWVLPLALYLLSFIIVFEGERRYSRPVVLVPLIAVMVAELWILPRGADTPILLQIAVHSAALFLGCLACHGELARLKPEPRRLTSYYLAIAAGGALGGAFVAVVAPRIFTQYLELHLGLWACCAAVLVALGADPRSKLRRGRPLGAWVLSGLALAGFGVGLTLQTTRFSDSLVAASRNFYGTVRVIRSAPDTERDGLLLVHGSTSHGVQFRDPRKRRWATTYYSTESGAGLAFRYYLRRSELDVGVVGLGIGTLATYGRPTDRFRFYEIDPRMERVARTHFRYLADSPADVKVVIGDARLSLEREPPQGFDLLFLDAFTSHSVPVHLLTREAFELYDRHLAPGGAIAVNVSHPHLDLQPVLRGAAARLGMRTVTIANARGPLGLWKARWTLLSRNERFLDESFIREAARRLPPSPRTPRLWTDDSANVLGIVTY
jgi:hypothetical protein